VNKLGSLTILQERERVKFGATGFGAIGFGATEFGDFKYQRLEKEVKIYR
jgi:hypothetical protein